MKSRWWWLAALALLAGCEEEADTVEPPEAVAPVEVSADDTAPAEGEDVEALQARIRELEAQVASQNAAPSAGTAEPTPVGGTQVAAVPEGTDPPAGGATEAEPSTASSRSGSGSSSSRRGSGTTTPTTPDGLLGALLGGPNGTTGSRRGSSSDDEEEEEEDTGGGGRNDGTLNPVDVLFPQ